MPITFQALSSSIDNFRSLIAICAGIRTSPQEMSQWSSRRKTRLLSLRRARLFRRAFSVKFSPVACLALLFINYELANLKKPLTWLFLFCKISNCMHSERLSSLQNLPQKSLKYLSSLPPPQTNGIPPRDLAKCSIKRNFLFLFFSEDLLLRPKQNDLPFKHRAHRQPHRHGKPHIENANPLSWCAPAGLT